ncbi:MAG: hypothetical protein K0S04_2659 [Herbinix sp.]|nr:hypothetical protein [Herbinix sp.]
MSFTMSKFSLTVSKFITNNLQRIKLGCMIIAAISLIGFSFTTAEAATGIKIYNYGTAKTTTYTGVQPKVTYNGTTVSNTSTPGILVSGVALVPYDDVFQTSMLAAECTYNEKKNTITIAKNGKTIVMTIGSKKATVNGSAVTLPVAPVKLKYVAAGKLKVLVPSRYVAESLGLTYAWNSKTSLIAIKKNTLTLSYNDGTKFEYSSTRGSVTIDGTKVSLGYMPSIISNNTAMLQAKKVFADSKISADYSYNTTTKKITLTKGSQTLVMTVGDKKATLNNKSIQLDAAPILVKNYENNVSYVMVPGSITTTSLGYQYQWNSSTKTSIITTKKTGSGSSSGNTAPELGDSDVVNETGTIINQWLGNEALYKKSSGVQEVNAASSYASGTIESVVRDTENAKMNSETYIISATHAFGKVTSMSSGNTITLTSENISCVSQAYQIYGVSGSLVNTIATTAGQSGGSTIAIETIYGDYDYDLTLSEDRKQLYVTVYSNTIIKATTGVNTAGDYLALEGLVPLNVSISEQPNLITLELPGIINSLGDINIATSGMQFMTQLSFIYSNNKTQILISLKDGYVYYFLENGNTYTLSFQNPNTSPVSGSGTKDIPVVVDTSSYEIVIPRPEGLTAGMVSDEDYYLSKYFVIRLAGDYKDFYNSNSITNTASKVKAVTVSVKNNVTEIKVTTSAIQGYELAWDDQNIYLNVGNPNEIYENIVVLDAGHGGTDVGAQYYGTNEKDVNYQILYTLGKQYFNSDTSKLKAYYTRTADNYLTLSERAAFVKQVGADLFVSLHMNAAENLSVSGTEVYYSKSNNSANSAGLTSQTLASMFLTNLVSELGTTKRSVKYADYTVIYKNTVPAVLIELGFLSNKTEHEKLTNEAFQTNAAKTIYETLLQVFEKYPS